AELLAVAEVVTVADVEVPARVLIDARQAPANSTEDAPANERAHRPGEVVVQTDQRDVGRGVRVVDRVDLVASDDRLARVELPPEECVDELRDRDNLVADLWREE